MSGWVLYGGAIGLTSGIFFRSFFFLDTEFVGLCILCLLIFLVLVSMVGRLRVWMIGLSVAAVLFGVGVVRFDAVQYTYDRIVSNIALPDRAESAFDGVVVRDVDRRDQGQVVFVETSDIGDEMILVRVTTDARPLLEYGDMVHVRGVLGRPRAFESELGRTFPYEEYLRAQGVTYTVSQGSVEVLPGKGGMAILRYVFQSKHAFLRSIELLLPEPHAGFASGLLLGEKYALGATLENVFRRVGIVHIIVLSGYNLTIVAESIMRLLSYMLGPRARACVGVGAIALFACMVGLSATVVRASIMAFLVLIARATGRTYQVMRALAVAGMVMLLWNPYVLVYDPGFQLSFLATLGLVFVAPLLHSLLGWVPTRLQIREYVTSTIATQIFVAPLLLYSVGTFSLISICANTLILVVVPLAMFATFFAAACGLAVGMYALPCAFPAYVLLSYMLTTAELLARVPFASFSVPTFPFMYVVCMYGVLVGILLYTWYRKSRMGGTTRSAFLGTQSRL